jgi:RNA polymerase sigma factor (sigma-70 family)
MNEDVELLREYSASGSEEAFRKLVERHSAMVHGVARRIAGESLADEVTQAVFLILARKGCPRFQFLPGWLYRTARFTALAAVRAERRRLARLEELSTLNPPSQPDSLWAQIESLLDGALARLRETDRAVLILRFLEERSFSEVAGALGISEGAAKMRVARAIENLRVNLEREGVAAPSATLSELLVSHGSNSVPAGLIQKLCAAASEKIPSETPVEIFVKGALKAMAMSKTKVAVLVILPLMLIGGAVVFETLPRPVVRSFEAMAGEWEGQMQAENDGFIADRGTPVSLRVRTSEAGRLCEIDMRVDVGEGAYQLFHFTHRIDDTGKSITTKDDPKVGLVDGPGKVIASEQNAAASTWRAGFRSPQCDGAGTSECIWTVHGDDMKIIRHDILRVPNGKVRRGSVLTLKRREQHDDQPKSAEVKS